jgi:glycosyltransferase involved in cell wall biosynthesis
VTKKAPNAGRGVLVISINSSWNIFNFRQRLIGDLQRSGYEVVALSPPDAYSARLAELGVRHIAIDIDSKGLSPSRDLRLLAAYYRALRQLRPAAYLGYTAKPNIWGSLAANALGIPVVNNVSGLGTAFISRGPLTSVVSSLYRLALRRSATVFFQNPEDLDLFLRKRLVSTHQAALLPGSGVDLERFAVAPLPHSRHPERFTFLLIARLLGDKGLREYVEAARLVKRSHPHVIFQVLGFLEAQNRSAISRAEVEGWVAEGAVEYLGSSEDVRAAIAAADCVVLPSYREGLPRTLLEAAAMGRPLIATDVPGCRHVVQEGLNGFLCAVRDASSLAEACFKMLALTEPRFAAMGVAARERVEREFSDAIVANSYIEALERSLHPTGGRPTE